MPEGAEAPAAAPEPVVEKPRVTEENIAEVVAMWTGIPVMRIAREESAKLLEAWLGSGLSLDDLPVPRVIIARV